MTKLRLKSLEKEVKSLSTSHINTNFTSKAPEALKRRNGSSEAPSEPGRKLMNSTLCAKGAEGVQKVVVVNGVGALKRSLLT